MATSSTRSSIVRRLTARAALWAVVIAVTLGGVAVWQYRRASLQALDERLEADARALAREIVVSNGLLEVDVPAEMRAALAAGSSYFGVHDAAGRLLDGDAPGSGPSPVRALNLVTADGHREVRLMAARGAVVRVGRPLGPMQADLWRLALSLLVASAVTLLLAAPLMVWLRRALAQSLIHFDRTAQALAPGRPARIDLAHVDHELAGVGWRLNEAFDRLEEGLRRERQLTADASHELRTPVATILAETEWALDRERTPHDYRHALAVCRRQGRRLKELIETLLTLARIESGEVPLAREPLDLAAAVDAVIADISPRATARGIHLARSGVATVEADRILVRILIDNLLWNAVRHNRDSGQATVTLAQLPDHGVSMTVCDTGPGLEPGRAERVFDRFWRGDPARAAGDSGTGLGLAICKAIVEAHGGTIACRSTNAGTCFIVDLPGAVAPRPTGSRA